MPPVVKDYVPAERGPKPVPEFVVKARLESLELLDMDNATHVKTCHEKISFQQRQGPKAFQVASFHCFTKMSMKVSECIRKMLILVLDGACVCVVYLKGCSSALQYVGCTGERVDCLSFCAGS